MGGLICNGEPSWATSQRGAFLGLFVMVSLPGLLHNGGLLGLICNGEPSWATSQRGPSWAYFNGEPSWATSQRGLLGLISMVSLPGLLHNGEPSWAYFNGEPSWATSQR